MDYFGSDVGKTHFRFP